LLKVCLICIELFGRGVYGGFGRATRKIGSELSKRNVEVTAVVPQREGSRDSEYMLDGIRVREFPQRAFWTSTDLFRQTDADVFHSQDPSLSTWLAMKAMPERGHVVTFRDTMETRDWRIEFRHAGSARRGTLAYALYVDNFLATRAVRRADGLYCAAEFLIPKAARKYGLRRKPRFLPTPVVVPAETVKAARPTVCFVGRLHHRKRPELFLNLAKAFPDVHFICVGGTNEREYEEHLRRTYACLPNLEMTGTIDQFQTDRLHRILEKSWVLVNTAAREGLPNTFLEAAANRCAILSGVDPDGFASRFGYYASDDGDLAKGLTLLLTDGRWKPLGEAGCQFVESVFGIEPAIERHLEAYEQALGARVRPNRPLAGVGPKST
jgi:glycosyltransferase involved in cell wall biosynthesis